MSEENSLFIQPEKPDIESEEEEDGNEFIDQEIHSLVDDLHSESLLNSSRELNDDDDSDDGIDDGGGYISSGGDDNVYTHAIVGDEPFTPPPVHTSVTVEEVTEVDSGSRHYESVLPNLSSPKQPILSLQPPTGEVSEVSNVFNGTSQEYSDAMHRKIAALVPAEYDNGVQLVESCKDVSEKGGEFCGDLSHLDRQQLEMLYLAKVRLTKELDDEVKRVLKEDEKKCGILRHQVKLLTSDKESLMQQCTELKNDISVLQTELHELHQQKDCYERTRQENDQLREQLSSSQTTISTLTLQVNELSSTEVLQKIRQNYESIITSEKDNHAKNIQEMENRLITLEKQLQDLQLENTALQEEVMLKTRSSCMYNTTGVCDKVIEVEQEKRIMEEERRKLIGEVEDLAFQLNTTQEELVVYKEQFAQLEQALQLKDNSHHSEMEKAHEEREMVVKRLTELRNEYLDYKNTYEANLKRSLEHCRSACLKLHEDSTVKLKEEFVDEKVKMETHYRNEIAKLRQSMGINNEKMKKDTEAVLQKQIDIALSAAHLAWKEEEKKRIQEHVRSALKKANADHKKHLAVVIKQKEKDWMVKYKEIATANSDGFNRKSEKFTSEIKKIFQSLQDSLIQLIMQTLKFIEERKVEEFHVVRQKALKEAEFQYLSCLHELVNNYQ